MSDEIREMDKEYQKETEPTEAEPADELQSFGDVLKYIKKLRVRNAQLARGRERAIHDVGIERVRLWFKEFELGEEVTAKDTEKHEGSEAENE